MKFGFDYIVVSEEKILEEFGRGTDDGACLY